MAALATEWRVVLMVKKEEDFRVKYIRSINNILEIDKNAECTLFPEEDRKNLLMLTGHLYLDIKIDGNMTKELADELNLTILWTSNISEDEEKECMKIQNFRDRFLMIQGCKDDEVRTGCLADLMTDMEGTFHIPLLYDEEFNRKNPVAMALYRDISNARVF